MKERPGLPKQERIFSISRNNKGLPCPFKPILCQEGYCKECQIYLKQGVLSYTRGGRMKTSWVCDEEGLICSACGKDIYHCECEEKRDELKKAEGTVRSGYETKNKGF